MLNKEQVKIWLFEIVMFGSFLLSGMHLQQQNLIAFTIFYVFGVFGYYQVAKVLNPKARFGWGSWKKMEGKQ